MTYSEKEMFRRTAGYSELFSAVKATLAKNGVLAQMRAEMLYAVFESLKHDSADALKERMGNPVRDAFIATGKFKPVIMEPHHCPTMQLHCQNLQACIQALDQCCRYWQRNVYANA